VPRAGAGGDRDRRPDDRRGYDRGHERDRRYDDRDRGRDRDRGHERGYERDRRYDDRGRDYRCGWLALLAGWLQA
jgi:hypothetical protein